MKSITSWVLFANTLEINLYKLPSRLTHGSKDSCPITETLEYKGHSSSSSTCHLKQYLVIHEPLDYKNKNKRVKIPQLQSKSISIGYRNNTSINIRNKFSHMYASVSLTHRSTSHSLGAPESDPCDWAEESATGTCRHQTLMK